MDRVVLSWKCRLTIITVSRDTQSPLPCLDVIYQNLAVSSTSNDFLAIGRETDTPNLQMSGQPTVNWERMSPLLTPKLSYPPQLFGLYLP